MKGGIEMKAITKMRGTVRPETLTINDTDVFIPFVCSDHRRKDYVGVRVDRGLSPAIVLWLHRGGSGSMSYDSIENIGSMQCRYMHKDEELSITVSE